VGLDAVPMAAQPPGADAHELMVTYRRRLMSFGTEAGTEVADVRGMGVEVAPAFGFVLARGVVAPGIFVPVAGAEEGLDEEQPANPRMQTSAAMRAALEPKIKSFFSRVESVPTRPGGCEHPVASSRFRRLVPSGGACAGAGWSPQ
jgi:hypothetical protein